MNRRQLLCALSAVVALPAAFGEPRHRLVGDGQHDDTKALQALVDGKPVTMPDGSIQQARYGQPVKLDGGIYLLTECVDLPSGTHLNGGHFRQTRLDTPVLRGRFGATDIVLRGAYYEGTSSTHLNGYWVGTLK